MAGSVFRRCGCGRKVPADVKLSARHECGKCGRADRFTYGYVVDTGVGPDGRRQQKQRTGFPNATEAGKELRKVAVKVDAGTFTEPAKVRVHEAVDAFLEAIKPNGTEGRRHRGKVGISTYDSYRVNLTAYVVPTLGGKMFADLSSRDIETLYDQLEASGKRDGTGMSAKSLANLHGVLSKLCKWTSRQSPPLLTRNPLEHVGAPKPSSTEAEVWTAGQLGTFLGHVREAHPGRAAFYYLASTTGMRRGEIAGLTWDDVDLEAGEVRITWTLGIHDAQPIWKHHPKSKAGERTMALDPATVAVLRDHRKRQAADQLAFGGAWDGSYTDAHGNSRTGLVFTWADGTVVHPERWTVWMHELCKEAKLPHRSPHELRHSYATIAASRAESFSDVIVLSRRLGHASVAMTLDTYGHALPRQDVAMAKGIAELIVGA